MHRTLLLASSDRHEAISALVEAACRDLPEVDGPQVLQAVQAREQEISTRIAPGIALPHARIPGLRRFIVAAGFSPKGLCWGSAEEQPVRLIVLLLGDAGEVRGHIQILGQLAALLQGKQIFAKLERGAGSPTMLYRALVGLQGEREPGSQAGEVALSRALFEHACGISRALRATAVLLLADEGQDLSFISTRSKRPKVLLATNNPSRYAAAARFFDRIIEVPFSGLDPAYRLELALFAVMSEREVDKGYTLVCVYGTSGAGQLDGLRVVDVERDFGLLLSLWTEFKASDIDQQVLHRLLHVATELAREGREGKAVGALFVLGAADEVLSRSQQMIVNPFKGYSEAERNILDPSLDETLKEFSLMDGAIVIRGDGVLMSAGTYLNTEGVSSALPPGLGARHAAAAAITVSTRAVSIAVSESTGTVRLFKRGKQFMAMKKARQ